MCSIGGQLNVLPKVIANPLFLISPAVYALMGVGFHFLSKKWGRSAAKDLTLIFIFGFVQGILTTLNAALTNTLAGGGWMIFTKKLSELSAEIVILRSLANALMFMSSYPMTVLLRSVFKTTDPFRPNLLELRNKKR